MRIKNVFKVKQSNCGYNRANERVWLEDYGREKFDWLIEHKLLRESDKRYTGESLVWKYYEFGTIGIWLNTWYNNTLKDFLYYYVFHLYQFRIWWERIAAKCGKRYAWQEYENVNIDEI